MRGLASLDMPVLDIHGIDSEAPHLAFALALDVKIDAAPGRKFDPLSNLEKVVPLSPRCSPLWPVDSYHRDLGPPPGLNSIIFLTRGINYSASRASENGMWDPSATPQDPEMLVHTLEGPVAQTFGPLMYCSKTT